MIDDSGLANQGDQLCDRFEAALRSGETPEIDAWLRRVPSIAERVLPELFGLELEYRLSRGEACSAEESLHTPSEFNRARTKGK
jgi:hypothetical protein